MPRRSLLTPAGRAERFAFLGDEGEIIRRYTLSTLDLSVIRRRRGDHNRLGFAVLLCCLRYPGFILPPSAEPPFSLLAIVGQQLQISKRPGMAAICLKSANGRAPSAFAQTAGPVAKN